MIALYIVIGIFALIGLACFALFMWIVTGCIVEEIEFWNNSKD